MWNQKAANDFLLLHVHKWAVTFVAVFAVIQASLLAAGRSAGHVHTAVQLRTLNPEPLQHFAAALSRSYLYLSLGFICLLPLKGTNKVLLNLNLIFTFTSSCGNGHFLPPGFLFVFRHLISKWFRSVARVHLQSNRALALAKFSRSKRLKVETNFRDARLSFVQLFGVLTSLCSRRCFALFFEKRKKNISNSSTTRT